jgi:hypothetical protein
MFSHKQILAKHPVVTVKMLPRNFHSRVSRRALQTADQHHEY